MFALLTFYKRLFLVVTLIAATSPAWSQDLSLEQAWSRATTHSPVLGQREAQTLEQEYALDEAFVEARPRLELSLQSQVQGPQQTLQVPGGRLNVNQTANYTSALTLEQSLDTFGRVRARSRQAQAQLEVSECQWAKSQDELAVQVSDAYLTVLTEKELLEASRWQLEAAQRALSDAQKAYKVGTAPAFDSIRADSRLARAQSDLTIHQLAHQNAMASLMRLLGQPLGQQLNLKAPSLEAPPEQAAPSYQDRPELLGEQLNLEVAVAGVERFQAEGGPQLALRASLLQQTETAFTPGTSWSVGLNFSYAFADGGLTAARTNQAKARLSRQEESLRALAEQLALEEVVASNQIRSDWSVMTSAASEREAAAEAARVAELRYRAGVAPGLELLETQADYAQAWSREVSARYTYQKNFYRWLRASAKPRWRNP